MTYNPKWIKGNEVVKRDGSNELTNDWDIGDKRKLILDELRIQDQDGFTISDTTGNPVVQVDDDGTFSLKNGTGINEFSTDGTLADDSDTAVPTEKAVKSYVDTEAGASTDLYYYVSTTGSDDTGDGSVGTPWQTITYALTQVPRFLNGYSAYIFLDDGTYTETFDIKGRTEGVIYILGQNYDPDTVLIEIPEGDPGLFIGDCWAGFAYLSVKIQSNNGVCILSYGNVLSVYTCKFGDNGNTNTVGIQCNYGTANVVGCGDIDANKVSTGIRGAGGLVTTDGTEFGDTFVTSNNFGYVSASFGFYGSTDWYIDINGNRPIKITPTSASEKAVLLNENGYMNFGDTPGDSGYGIRDNTGVLEIKHLGESWNRIRYQKIGSGSLENDATSATILFFSEEPDEDYSIKSLVLVNEVDDPPSFYSMIVTSKTTLGFTVLFSGPIDSGNYKLEWSIER
jgi:hypothetical protein